MLEIVERYHWMQFQGKLMNQTWKNGSKEQFRTWFWPICAKFGPPKFFSKIWLCYSVDILNSYHHVQYQKKLVIKSWQDLVTDGWTDWRTDRPMDRQTIRQLRVISLDLVRLTSSVQYQILIIKLTIFKKSWNQKLK